MIISASYKTDIPAFYSEWFMRRLEARYCTMVNAFNRDQMLFVGLRPQDVTGIVFWTKNIGPLLPHLAKIREMGYPFVVQHTINGYAQSRFEAVVSADEAVANLWRIREQFGQRVAVWRYDPIVITTNTPIERHQENFGALAEKLRGVTDEVVISFVQPYKKTQANMSDRGSTYGFEWIDNQDFTIDYAEKTSKTTGKVMRKRVWREKEESLERKRELAHWLADTAHSAGMQLTICSPPEGFYPESSDLPTGVSALVPSAHCVDSQRLGDVIASPEFQESPGGEIYRKAQHPPLPTKIHGNRATCACFPSRDIGEYDTCPYGCAYCYAVSNREVSKRFYAEYGAQLAGNQQMPNSPFLDPRYQARFPFAQDTNWEWCDDEFAKLDIHQKAERKKHKVQLPAAQKLDCGLFEIRPGSQSIEENDSSLETSPNNIPAEHSMSSLPVPQLPEDPSTKRKTPKSKGRASKRSKDDQPQQSSLF